MKKYNIILVENDEDEQEFMKEGFDAVGLFNVIAQVRNGDHLLDWLAEHRESRPDIILSDLNMPGKNGYDIILDIKSSRDWSNLPVIITSTSSSVSHIANREIEGLILNFGPPFNPINFSPLIRNVTTIGVSSMILESLKTLQ